LAELGNFVETKESEKAKGIQIIDRNYSKKPEDIVGIDCDILVLAAVNLTLTKDNAHQVKAKVVAEAGNGMTDTEADQILKDRGIDVLPDIWVNAGGVVESGYEYLQGKGWERLPKTARRDYWKRERSYRLMAAQLIAAGEAMYPFVEGHSLTWREAADARALQMIDIAYRHVVLGQSLDDIPGA
jgi:glutamate dehydrogenase/leucine dehydrogenase